MGRRNRAIGGFTLRNGIFVPSLVRSVQRGTITIGPGDTFDSAVIDSVSMANSVLRLLSYWNSGNAADITEDNCLLTFASNTAITAEHQTAGNTIVASFEVMEYVTGVIRSIQRGTIALVGVASNTDTLSPSVNTDKTSLDCLGFTYTGNASVDYRAGVRLTNETTVTATRIGVTDDMVIGYQAVTWW